MHIRDRIKELRRVNAADLLPHPKNWRVHPTAQREALQGVLAQVGYADALLVRECSDGRLQLIDGHLRAETTPDHLVPVLVLDVDEREADLILATHDPLAGLAVAEAEQLADLLTTIEPASEAVAAMLADLARPLGIAGDSDGDHSANAGDQTDQLADKFEVLVTCADEQEQRALLDQLTAEGYSCRALIA